MQLADHSGRSTVHFSPDAFRQTVISSAKRFKSSWVELGKLLVRVRDEGLFAEWGFATFEAYCLAELHIRKQTALKLTRSFSFLNKHEPKEVAAPQIAETAPPFDVVEVLAKAEERGQLSASDYKSVRDSIWNPEKTATELKRDLMARFPAAEAESENLDAVKRLYSSTKRLAAELRGNKKIPRAIAERAEELARDLEELLSNKADA